MNRAPLSGIEWSALAMAIVIANAFYFRGLLYPSDYDAALYVEIAIEIDGWLWNLADAPSHASHLFPLTERLLRRWEHDREKRAA